MDIYTSNIAPFISVPGVPRVSTVPSISGISGVSGAGVHDQTLMS